MTYTPKGNRYQTALAVAVSLLCALVLIGFSLTTGPFSARVMKASAAILIMYAVLLVPRFILCSFTYRLEDFEFSAIRNSAGTTTPLCRLYYTEITGVMPYKEAKKHLKGRTRHSYCPSIFSRQKYCIFFDSGEERGVVIIEAAPAFTRCLHNYVRSDFPDSQG